MKKLLTMAVMASTVLLSSSVASAMFTIDADSYADGANMSSPGYGVTLSSPFSGAFSSDGYVYAQTAADSSHASTGTNVFGNSVAGSDVHGNPFDEIWHQTASYGEVRLRADFAAPANYVAIDIIGNNDLADYGILEAYDSGGSLLASVSNGSALYDGDVFTATITRPSYDIAYVIASGIGGNTVHLDNLEANVIPAPGAVLMAAMGVGLVGWLRRSRAF
ncbi:MAG: hypothetical protein JSV99_10435 [Planctomycetota bacterium]|nr:MAG: hypothetical protein JSV99_10435 [Planctomycetota bacterium]